MAVEARDHPELARKETSFGESLIFWSIVLILGIGIFAWGLAVVPDTGGYLLVIISSIPLGVGYAQIVTGLPTVTHRIAATLVIAAIFFGVLFGVVGIIGQAFPTPSAPSSVLLQPDTTS